MKTLLFFLVLACSNLISADSQEQEVKRIIENRKQVYERLTDSHKVEFFKKVWFDNARLEIENNDLRKIITGSIEELHSFDTSCRNRTCIIAASVALNAYLAYRVWFKK